MFVSTIKKKTKAQFISLFSWLLQMLLLQNILQDIEECCRTGLGNAVLNISILNLMQLPLLFISALSLLLESGNARPRSTLKAIPELTKAWHCHNPLGRTIWRGQKGGQLEWTCFGFFTQLPYRSPLHHDGFPSLILCHPVSCARTHK